MSLHTLLEKQYGVKTSYRINPQTDSVAILPTKILSYNPTRLGWVFINDGAFPVYLSPVNDVSATKGILVSSGGGGVSFAWNEDFEMVSSEWYAISIGGVSAVYLHEVVDNVL